MSLLSNASEYALNQYDILRDYLDIKEDVDRETRIAIHTFRVAVDPDHDIPKPGHAGYLYKCIHCEKKIYGAGVGLKLPDDWRRVRLGCISSDYKLLECDECVELWDDNPACQQAWENYIQRWRI